MKAKLSTYWQEKGRYSGPQWLYIVVVTIEFLGIHFSSDLPTWLRNWAPKAELLLQGRIPDDNFYGPGSAIMLIPFLWSGPTYFLANVFYFSLATYFYFKICSNIQHVRARVIALAALPLNIYLLWLCNSSQDTVFEFFLCTLMLWALLKSRWIVFTLAGLLLSEARSGYWVTFLGISIILLIRGYRKNRKINWRWSLAFPLLVVVTGLNILIYSSPSPALEAGMTLRFSYSKYYYLSHPKFDMDVFLSGKNGIFSEKQLGQLPSNMTQAEENSEYVRMAIQEAVSNPKETILGWMQKFDSQIFDVQKVPHLPGSYVLDPESKTISIEEERLGWVFVLGNLLYMLYRSILVVTGLLGIGMLLQMRRANFDSLRGKIKLGALAYPWVFGFVPAILIYSETRFKIVSELMLIPLIAEIWAIYLLQNKSSKNSK